VTDGQTHDSIHQDQYTKERAVNILSRDETVSRDFLSLFISWRSNQHRISESRYRLLTLSKTYSKASLLNVVSSMSKSGMSMSSSSERHLPQQQLQHQQQQKQQQQPLSRHAVTIRACVHRNTKRMLAASMGRRYATVWRPSICLPVPFFFNLRSNSERRIFF